MLKEIIDYLPMWITVSYLLSVIAVIVTVTSIIRSIIDERRN